MPTVPIQTATQPPVQHPHRSRVVKRLLLITLLAFTVSSLSVALSTVTAHAQSAPASNHPASAQPEAPGVHFKAAPVDPCLANVPAPDVPIGLHRVVQLVNCSRRETLLGTANAAQQLGSQPLPVLPREGTWEMKPYKAGQKLSDQQNVLTIDIPLGWENTACPQGAKTCDGIIGPRLWARTACRYDIAFDIAQCETGGCSGRYDCSAARLSSTVGTTISEWTFAEPVTNGAQVQYLKDSPDISAVDGANLNLDIQPVGSTPHDPFDTPPDWSLPKNPPKGHDIQWLAEQYPLTVHGQDLRNDAACNVATGLKGCCPPAFRLKRSTLTTGNPFGFVIVDKPGHPVGGDSTVACSRIAPNMSSPLRQKLAATSQTPIALTGKPFASAIRASTDKPVPKTATVKLVRAVTITRVPPKTLLVKAVPSSKLPVVRGMSVPIRTTISTPSRTRRPNSLQPSLRSVTAVMSPAIRASVSVMTPCIG